MATVRPEDLKKEWKPENKAEAELMKRAEQAFDLFVDSLMLEMKKVLLEEV